MSFETDSKAEREDERQAERLTREYLARRHQAGIGTEPDRLAETERELLARIEALLDAMETCSVCGCLLLIDTIPTHCEDCFESEDDPEPTQIGKLHEQSRAAVKAFRTARAGGERC